MPNYLHVMGRWDTAGIGRFVESLVLLNDNFDSRHDLLLMSPDETDEVPAPILEACNVHRISKMIRFWRISQDYDAFFLHGTNIAAVVPLMMGRRPCLVFQHGISSGKGNQFRRARRRLWHSAAIRFLKGKLICATEFARQKVTRSGIQVFEKDIEIVPFGIPLTRTLIAPPPMRAHGREITVGLAARLVAQKRFDLVLSSLASYAGEMAIRILVAGDGPESATLREMTRSLGENVTVEFLGYVDDMPSFYDRLDLFLLPSRRESFGLVVPEAMDRCIPVAVFPDVGGCLPLVEHGRNGFVLDDGIPGLDTLWENLNREPAKLKEMSANLRETDMSEHDIARTRQKLERLVEQALDHTVQ